MSKHRPLTSAAVTSRAVAAGLFALLVSGCAGDASPGAGLTVGDETISTSRIDETTSHLCTALTDRFEGRLVPLGDIRRGVVQLLALRSQSEQLAEDYDVSPSATYQRAVAENTRAAALMPEEVREDYVEVFSTEALATDVVEQIGRSELAAQGFDDPTVDQITQAGSDVFATWPDANGVEVNPKYGVELSDGALAPVDTNLSFAVSDEAKGGMASYPDADATSAYAETLPANQRCGG